MRIKLLLLMKYRQKYGTVVEPKKNSNFTNVAVVVPVRVVNVFPGGFVFLAHALRLLRFE